jgi:hypothetical protein
LNFDDFFYLIYVGSSKIMEEVMMDVDGYDEQQIMPDALPFARRLFFFSKQNLFRCNVDRMD